MMKTRLYEALFGTPARVMTVAAALTLAVAGCEFVTAPTPAPDAPKAAEVAAAAGTARVRVSADGVNAAEPSVAAADGGAVYVAWVGHGAGKEADVWVARFDDKGKREGEPTRVNPTAGGATAWRGDPPDVAVAPDGTLYVAWTARAAESAHATTLYLSASRDGGRSFAPPVKVNDDAGTGVHGMHSLTVGRDGRVYLAWLDERNLHQHQEASQPGDGAGAKKASGGMHGEQNREVFFAASNDGGRTFSPNRRVASEACPCCQTALAVSGEGRVYVGWRQVLPGDMRHIAVASTEDDGETFAAPTVVSDDRWELRGCPVSGPALAAGAGGGLRVLWFTAGEAGRPGLYSSESSDGGRTFAPRRLLKEGNLRGTPLLLADARGGLVAVFEGANESGTNGLWRLRLEEATGGAGGASPVANGESASAVVRNGRLNVAYVAQGGVWLAGPDGGE